MDAHNSQKRSADGAAADFSSKSMRCDALQAAQAAVRTLTSKWDNAPGAAGGDGGRPGSKWDMGPGPGAPGNGMGSMLSGGASTSAAAIDAILGSNVGLIDGPPDATGLLPDFDMLDVNIKLSLHNDAISALLAHNGAALTAIRTSSGCRIKLPFPGQANLQRFIQLGGSQEGVSSAIGLLLAETQKACATNPLVCTAEKLQGETVMSFNIRMMVPSLACGSIIGKGGSVILGIRAKSNAIVKVEEAAMDATERPISIIGPIERVHVGVLDIIGIVAKFTQQLKAKGGAGPMAARVPAETSVPTHEHRVATHLAGKLIGPGGSSIREIRDKSGARVKVNDENPPNCGERAVSIWGTPDQVTIVVGLINEILSRPDVGRPPRKDGGGSAAPAGQQQMNFNYGQQPPPQQYGYAPPQQYQQAAPQQQPYAPPMQYGAPPQMQGGGMQQWPGYGQGYPPQYGAPPGDPNAPPAAYVPPQFGQQQQPGAPLGQHQQHQQHQQYQLPVGAPGGYGAAPPGQPAASDASAYGNFGGPGGPPANMPGMPGSFAGHGAPPPPPSF